MKERDESSNGGSSLFFGKSSGNNIRGENPTFLNVIRKVRLPFFLCVTGFLFLFSVCQGVVLPALACTEEGGILSSHFPGMEKTGGVGKEKTAESALSCGIPSHISDSLLFSIHFLYSFIHSVFKLQYLFIYTMARREGSDFGMQGLISIINDIQEVFSIVGRNLSSL